ncbi:cbb3-type cytochrome c oxidase subunit I [Flavobacterium psychrophilum]|uniref:Cbb3-type cytochrome c oxidase subunit I n=2 Tax=Flavobacterium psychrophilum TaxID=96345 RepID=A0A238P6B5_FLAPS|nr:cbb3-type cytochrome c oxidase subunit I [Flavobacterium psychrophilum]AIN73287.1 cytochrome C oxidase [Flavobacterium psychrophilum FPG3]EKT2069636.1 cbb3-type cytochrome c oxidase subunit I [Flavobacterium psychrophilum]EKT2071896.1 cbb3-type cytochrome c oxidase subunit I [Flavobacterium psychrophilum]EKT3956992.1 cbb3-type cytochrome c oxidase subunit I [Flavobacterium psychrophilum]EKT3962959.1 cbb3-type cytochrome c oxidase subunit I [Flavobacterium psychrophilum]
MAAASHDHDHAHDHDHEHHHKDTFITKYIFSLDHKMIAKQYLISGIIMGIIGVIMSLLFRLQIAWPEQPFKIFDFLLGDKLAPGGVMRNDIYLALVTIHGTIMVFFVLTAGLSGTFSNLLIPLQIGARDMASGFLNMLSYWLFFTSAVIMLSSLFVESGPASAGWTIYPPLSALPQAIPGSGTGMTLWLVSMAIFIASSLMGSLNYVVTVINLRTKGMSMTRLPLTIWAFFVTAIIGIVSFPVLLSAALLLIMDRSFGTSFFLSDIFISGEVLHYQGGSPVLFEHLFWFLGHPEVYIVLLPALGITSEVIATNSRKPIFGYRAMIASILAIAFLSTIVWGHHMFVSGMNPFLGSVFTFTTLLIAIPSAVKAFNYITTLWKGNLQLNPAMLFSIGLVSTFISGGITGIVLGDSTLDINVHDTYFVVAHFHLVMGISALYGFFAGVYHWFPKMFGRMMNKNLGYIHFWITAICAYGVFYPMHFIGMAGLPRRYYTNTNFPLFDDLADVNKVITTFALIGAAFQLVFMWNFFTSIFYGKKAVQNPWRSNTLEWTTPVEHVHGNWPGAIPEVYRWPYDYSKPGHDEDFVPQTVPMKEGEEELHHS